MSLRGKLEETLYLTAVQTYFSSIRLAGFHNDKAKKWTEGRKNLLRNIKTELEKKPGNRVWFHCSSLGEFEQGKPVIEALKKQYPEKQIVLTFFSPSGYELRKNYPHADFVFYLPEDTPNNAREFIQLVKPQLAFFIKYDYWYFYFKELKNNNIPLFVISALFRKNQPFFQFYGGVFREMLKAVTHFFVQDDESIELLKGVNIHSASIINDTRIDRVAEIAKSPDPLGLVKEWKKAKMVIIGGSTYKTEEDFLCKLFRSGKYDGKIIIAPHDVSKVRINEISQKFGNESILFSQLTESNLNKRVLIIDSIGILSSLYQYSDIAFIGGGFGKNIHNILEPAAFAQPIIFGPKYKKFIEAKELVAMGGAFEVLDYEEFESNVLELLQSENWVIARRFTDMYIRQHLGGTQTIIDYLTEKKLLINSDEQ